MSDDDTDDDYSLVQSFGLECIQALFEACISRSTESDNLRTSNQVVVMSSLGFVAVFAELFCASAFLGNAERICSALHRHHHRRTLRFR